MGVNMAIYRNIQMSFWTDSKVVDDFTPEDKYFYLYLMTNPHTNLAGCYEISLKQISDETGYNKDSVEKLLKRMEYTHKVIKYSKDTKEILILKWGKFNWTKSKDFQKPLLAEIENVKNAEFKGFLMEKVDELNDNLDRPKTVLRPSQDPVGTTVTDTVYNNNINNNKYLDNIKRIIDYLNITTGSKYKYTTEKNKRYITARLNEGFTFEDFKAVIDKKTSEWKGTEWEKFLRPETLFGTKFEGYLNQRITTKQTEVYGTENIVL